VGVISAAEGPCCTAAPQGGLDAAGATGLEGGAGPCDGGAAGHEGSGSGEGREVDSEELADEYLQPPIVAVPFRPAPLYVTVPQLPRGYVQQLLLSCWCPLAGVAA
jgi:hypothetical protein